ncbi:MAG TPA: AraC family transcriptional regulator, partial [Alteromonas australica]|nr:AraC family transcriptional regulator [Alteromonas australica]
RITTSSPIVILLIEPDSFFADALQPSQQKGLIVQSLSLEMLDTLLADIPLRDMMNKLETLYHQNNSVIDARLISAMTYLNSIDKRPTVELIGKHVGLSVSRLRALSTHYLGVPFSKIIVWKQVNLAFQSLAKGASLADAAYDAGFADQAHFTRILRDTIGVTPGQTQNMDKQ